MPGFAVWRKKYQSERPPLGFDWLMPCGAYFKKEQDASWHMIDCAACDVAQREKGFGLPKED